MKIGFLTRTLMMTERYWDKLQDKADCWWAVTQQPLYDALRKRGHTKIAFHREKQRIDKTKRSGNQFVTLNPGKSENAVARIVNPDIWITESLNRLNYVPKNVPWIQIFHSLPLKKHFFHPPVLEYDLMLLPGDYHKNELIKRLGMKDNDERLKVVGWPRIDDFLNGVFDRSQIMNQLGLDEKRKTLMYAPTWGWGYGNGTFFARWLGREAEIFENLCCQAKEMGLNFMVKLHSLSFYAGNKEMIDIAEKYDALWLTEKTSGFQEDPNPLLWVTDILISDLSGIITDFLVLDRPIIYIEPEDKLDAWALADMPKGFRAGYVVETADELIRAIADSISRPDKFKQQRQDLVSKLFYLPDGKATDRAAEEILNFANK